MRITSLCLVLTLFWAVGAGAARLPIENPGFELPWVPEDADGGVDTGSIQGWAESQDGRQGLLYHFGAGIPDPPEGFQSAYLRSYWTPNANNGIWQTLTVAYQAQAYTLRFKARSYTSNGANNNLNVRLYAGDKGTVVLEENVTWTDLTDDFNEVSFAVTIEPDSPFVGQPIGIHFNHNKAHGNSWVLLDDVRLETLVAEASLPTPADDSLLEATATNLLWQSGDFTAKTLLALDDNFDDVNDGKAEYNLEPTEPNVAIGVAGGPYPDGLAPGTRYYWQVTEVNEANPDSPWVSAVWSFMVPPLTAWNPLPSDGFNIADPNGSLSWSRGMNGLTHTVYFGTDRDTVENATEGGVDVGEATRYDPGLLEKSTVYFWRVDTSDGSTLRKGMVWTFETIGDIAITDPSLLVHYTFNEGEGSRAIDFSGHKNDGVLKGDTAWVAGIEGSAIDLDGVGDWVELGQVLDTPDFCLSAWLKTDVAHQDRAGSGYFGGALITSAVAIGGAQNDFALAVNGTQLNFGLGNQDGERYGLYSNVDVVTGEWVHVAAVRDVTTLTARVYVDGNLDNEAPYTNDAILNQNETIEIGGNLFNNLYLDGSIDEVRIYNKVLTDSEVKTLARINPLKAYDPLPASGATVEFETLSQLAWTAGDNATHHDIYFGTDRNAVAEADINDANGIYLGRRDETTLDVIAKAWGQQYYWRIDEVDADGTVTPGSIWTYSIASSILIEGFEDYASEGEDNRIWMVWQDAFGDVAQELGFGGSILEHATAPLMEEVRVREGNKAMPFYYDNDGLFFNVDTKQIDGQFFSKVQRSFDNLDITKRGEQAMLALSVWVRGVAENAPLDPNAVLGTVSAILTDADGKEITVQSDNPDLLTSVTYTELRFNVADVLVAGLDATRIASLTVAVGDLTNQTPGHEGLLLVDDVRLYADIPEPQEE